MSRVTVVIFFIFLNFLPLHHAFSADAPNQDSQVKRVGGITVDKKNNSVTSNVGGGRRGGRLARTPISTKIIRQKEWSLSDWIWFVLSFVAGLIMLACFVLFAQSTYFLPEPIIFNAALLSASIAFGGWLRLFNLPDAVANSASFLCLTLGIVSGIQLFRAFLRFKEDQKKPDIYN